MIERHWAYHYIGKPWVRGATGPDAYDCYNLVRRVLAERYGVEAPVVDVDACNLVAVARAFRDKDGPAGGWRPVAEPRDGDVVLMSHARRPHHVGLWLEVDDGGVLHAEEGGGVLFNSPVALRMAGWRILGYRRRTDAG